ncbi:MAG TPA: cytochrome C [Geobacter sp.]|nr:cytochrome C [Geobacter sp.]
MTASLSRTISILLIAILLGACSKSEAPAPAPRKAGFPEELTGEPLFAQRCLECHMVHGKGGRVGPDLSLVGGKRNRAFLEQVIREPSKVYPGTVMPPNDTLSTKQVDSLVDYLGSLK